MKEPRVKLDTEDYEKLLDLTIEFDESVSETIRKLIRKAHAEMFGDNRSENRLVTGTVASSEPILERSAEPCQGPYEFTYGLGS